MYVESYQQKLEDEEKLADQLDSEKAQAEEKLKTLETELKLVKNMLE